MTAIETYRAFLGAADVDAFPIDPLDRLGVPVWSAGAHDAHGVGYGPTPEVAERGALGEACEVLGALRYSETTHAVALSVADAVARGAVHPRELSLPLGTALRETDELLWVEAWRWPDRRPCLVPLEAAVTTLGEFHRVAGTARTPLFPPITNGQGAFPGSDPAPAVRHGLNEVLQRELNWSQFKAMDTGRAVDPDAVAPELAARMREAGVEPVLKWSGEAFGVHAFHAAAIDGGDVPPIVRTATGEGADPDPAVAARKALTELCSSRSRKWFFFGGDDALRVAPPRYRSGVAAKPPPSEAGWDLIGQFEHLLGDPEALGRVVGRITRVRERVPMPDPRGVDPVEALAAEGFEVLVVPMATRDVQVVKVVVPGLECEVLSHHRIGPRAEAVLRERFGGVDPDELRRLAFDFLPLYREPDRHAFTCSASPSTPTA